MWCYVTQELGIPGSRIIVSGDSAGGNAVLALLRYLEEFGEKLGLEKPKAAWLW
jgi:acetyl esterase/lipase